MTTHYVDSAATGANDGTSWADAWTSIASAVSVSAGDEIFVDDGHSETALGSLNFSNGTRANPVKIICVDKTDDSFSTGAECHGNGLALAGFYRSYNVGWYADDSSGSDLSLQTTQSRYAYIEGGVLKGNDSRACSATEAEVEIVGVTFADGDPSYCKPLSVGGRGSRNTFRNCTIAASITGCLLDWPYYPAIIEFYDCDLSDCDYIMDAVSGATHVWLTIRRCKLKAGWNLCKNGSLTGDLFLQMDHCDDGTITDPSLGVTLYTSTFGTVGSVLTNYRSNGADDGENANGHSLEMTTNSSALEIFHPIKSPPITRWIDPATSPSGATARNIVTSTRCDPQATPTALPTDSSSTWNGTGVGTKQKIEHTLTNGDTLTVYVASGGTLYDDDFWIEVSEPDQVGGPVSVVFYLAKPSTTVYVDPILEVA